MAVGDRVLGGVWQTFEIDETYVGGVRNCRMRGRGAGDKNLVLGMMDSDEFVTKFVISSTIKHLTAGL